jgi:hypothetical protein
MSLITLIWLTCLSYNAFYWWRKLKESKEKRKAEELFLGLKRDNELWQKVLIEKQLSFWVSKYYECEDEKSKEKALNRINMLKNEWLNNV